MEVEQAPIPLPQSESAEIFKRDLQRVVARIFAEADGRTCGGCTNYDKDGWCRTRNNINGGSLIIFHANAPACKEHKAD